MLIEFFSSSSSPILKFLITVLDIFHQHSDHWNSSIVSSYIILFANLFENFKLEWEKNWSIYNSEIEKFVEGYSLGIKRVKPSPPLQRKFLFFCQLFIYSFIFIFYEPNAQKRNSLEIEILEIVQYLLLKNSWKNFE